MMVTRLGGVRAHITRTPSGFGPMILVGELRDNQGRPMRTSHRVRTRRGIRHVYDPPVIRCELDTDAGLAALLAGLTKAARNKTLHAVAGRLAVTQYPVREREAVRGQGTKALEDDGYGTIRAGGSRGAADLIALKPGQTLIIQCKRTNPLLPPAERVKLLDLARMCGGLPIVAYQPAPRRKTAYRQLTGPGPKDWVEFTPDEVAAKKVVKESSPTLLTCTYVCGYSKDMNTAARDFTAEYIAARKVVRSADTMKAQYDAEDAAAKIARTARRAGVKLDEITLDEQARVELYG